MWTYNCARVYVGKYLADINELSHEVSCNYEIVEGKVSARKLKPIKIRESQTDSYGTLQTFSLSPLTDTAIIRINSGKGSHLVKLIKPQQGIKHTVFKEIL